MQNRPDKNTTTKTALNVKSNIKAAGMGYNHNRALSALKVKAGLRAGGMGSNHSRSLTAAR